jgi:hypothetical protein
MGDTVGYRNRLRLVRRALFWLSVGDTTCLGLFAVIDKDESNSPRFQSNSHCPQGGRDRLSLARFKVPNGRNADARGFRQLVLRNLKPCACCATLSGSHALPVMTPAFFVKVIVLR